jgi:protein gp37
MAQRLQAMGAQGYDNGFDLTLLPERLVQPLQRRKPTTYFVNSMSDVFHEDIPDTFIQQIFDVIDRSPQHIFQILTKREQRLYQFLHAHPIPKNVWLGVSVENKKYGLPRIDVLRQINAPIRFLSIEPLLEDLGTLNLSGIHWVIVGGESGPKARPMNPDWVKSIKEQCDLQRVPFFFKQWGTWGPDGKKRSKKTNGRLLFGEYWNALPLAMPT